MIKKLLGSSLVFLGFLLSPLCWWNDLIINLPIAYGVGAIAKLFSEQLFWPFVVVGYSATNVLGIVLMQLGTQGLLDPDSKKAQNNNLVKSLAFSSVYTIGFLVLLKLNILDTSFLPNK